MKLMLYLLKLLLLSIEIQKLSTGIQKLLTTLLGKGIGNMSREPVLNAAAIVGLVELFVIMLVSLGILRVEDTQLQTILNFSAAFIMITAPVVGAWIARRYTWPMLDPRDDEGNELVVGYPEL